MSIDAFFWEDQTMFKTFCKYVSLNVLGMIALSCYILADTFFVSQGLGTNGLTALNLAIPIYSFIHGTGLMIGMGASSKFSILKGQNKHDRANHTFMYALYLGAFFAIIYVLIGLFFCEPLLALYGAQDAVMDLSLVYLRTILSFSPFFISNNIVLCFVRNDGSPQLSMAGMIIGSFSNILLDWFFIFPCGWGMFGAAFATGLAPIISLCITSMHFLQKKNTFHVSRCTFSVPQALQIVSMGLPSLVTEAASGIVIILFNMLFMHLDGNTAVAAYGIVANISLVVLSVFTGIAQGIQPILSKAYGQQNHRALQKTYGYAIKTMLVYAIVVFLFLVWKSNGITAIFNSQQNEHLQVLANQGIVLYFIACPFAGFNIITSITFSSTQMTVYGQILSLLRSLILIVPMALLLAFTLGIPGVWLSFPVTEILVSLYGFTLIKKNLYSL